MEFSKIAITNPAIPGATAGSGVTFLGNLIPALLSALLVIGVVVFLFFLLLGAIQWITAGGDKGKLEGAKTHLTNAIIGVFILLSFFAIVSLVECFFGIGLRSINIGPFNINFASVPYCPAGGGGGGTGGGQGGGLPPGPGIGNANCGCVTGSCAQTGQIGLGNDGQCWTCAASGWANPTPAPPATCPPISCVTTCQ